MGAPTFYSEGGIGHESWVHRCGHSAVTLYLPWANVAGKLKTLSESESPHPEQPFTRFSGPT